MNRYRHHHRRRLLPAAACSLVIAMGGCSRTPPPATQTGPPAQPVTPTIEVVHVVERQIDLTLDVPGELNPYQTVAVFPKVTGFIKSIRVDRGSHVQSGETIAELEAPELLSQRAEAQSKVQAAQAQLAAARSKMEATTGTYEKLKAASATPGVVAGNDLIVAQKALEADQNQISALQQNVEAARQALAAVTQMEGYLRVTAPFTGIVTERNVHPGTLVGPGSGAGATVPLVRIVDNSRLRLTVPVPEAYVAGVSAGAALTFTVSTYPGQTQTGTVARLADVIDQKTRTMAVELDVANKDGQLSPGAFCQVRWPVRRSKPSLFVPSRSVANTTGRTFVVRIRDGKAEWVDVKTGLPSGTLIEVFGELHAGDVVAARGTDEIRANTEVKITESKGS